MNVGDLVGIQWKAGIGYVGSKTGAHIGLVLELDEARSNVYVVYCPTIKAFNTIKHWDSTWLVELPNEICD